MPTTTTATATTPRSSSSSASASLPLLLLLLLAATALCAAACVNNKASLSSPPLWTRARAPGCTAPRRPPPLPRPPRRPAPHTPPHRSHRHLLRSSLGRQPPGEGGPLAPAPPAVSALQPLRARAASAATGGLPGWEALVSEANATPTGQRMIQELEAREKGEGGPHTDATLRLFGHAESDVRVTLYRDRAAWCPYCQKVWIMLEEKRIPYKIAHINMRSYGPKPQWFLDKVPNGLLPAVELDGRLYTDSIPIMKLLDAEFADFKPDMVPRGKSAETEQLYRLERALFGAWCEYLFYPPALVPNPLEGLFGGQRDKRRERYESLLDRLDEALGEAHGRTGRPFLLGTEHPTFIDLQFVTHVERMEASVVYWKGIKMRGAGRTNLDRWLEAFEGRESYRATKSDFYTHVMDIPPQYGEAFVDLKNPKAREAVDFIGGGSWNYPKDTTDALGNDRKEPISRKRMQGASWQIPVPNGSPDCWEPIREPFQVSEEAARHEAAFEITRNYEGIVKFMCRANGDRGELRYSAPLADPFALAEPGDREDADMLLRMTTLGLLSGSLPTFDPEGIPEERRVELGKCVKYLRDRIGVPRDMSFPAAQHLRGYLNHLVRLLVPRDFDEKPSKADLYGLFGRVKGDDEE